MAEDEEENKEESKKSLLSRISGKTKTVASKGYAAAKTHGDKLLKIGFAVFAIIILAVLGFFGYLYYSQSETGRLGAESIKEGSVEASKGLKSLGFSKSFNILKQLFKGTYDPSSMWTAERVQSEYSDVEELEFVIKDLHSPRDFYYPGEELQLNGRIDVIGGIKKGTPVELSFGDSCPVGDSDCTESELGGEDWTCYISGSEQENKFEVRKAYNRIFYCTHPAIYTDENLVYAPTLQWEYETEAVATKQIYVASREVLEREENPVEYFEVDEDTLKTWYLGEERVNVGMGLDRELDFVMAHEGITPEPIKYLLGVSIQNNGEGKITSVNNLELLLPSNPNLRIVETAPGEYYNFETPEYIEQDSFKLVKYPLKTSLKRKISDNHIEPGEHETYYLQFWVDKDYLEASSYQSFNVKLNLDYTYQDSDKTTIKIRTEETQTE